MSQETAIASAGLMKFYSKEELRRYLKSLTERYQAQNLRYGDHLGGLLRTLEAEKAAGRAQSKEQKDPRQQAKGWVKMGTLLVNVNDPTGAMAEVLFRLHEDGKTRLSKANEALRSFEELSSTTIPEAGLYYLQLKNGVPERVVVDLQHRKKDAFNFSAEFQLV